MGAVVSVVLLIPAVIAFFVDRLMQQKQVALLSARAVPLMPRPSRRFDWIMLLFCSVIGLFLLSILLTCQFAALTKFYPYDLSVSLRHYRLDLMDSGGFEAYGNSLRLAFYTAIIGTFVVFTGAYMVEKGRGFDSGRAGFQFLAMMPMAVLGMVLGLAYILFFNNPSNPLRFAYGTMVLLVVCTITHFYTVAYLTALTALKQIDAEFEAVSASLKQPFYKMLLQVTVPVCLPAILDIAIYLFVNAMTTVSAVVFLYSPETTLAAVAVLNMDDAGNIAPAAAMGMMIFYTTAVARLLHVSPLSPLSPGFPDSATSPLCSPLKQLYDRLQPSFSTLSGTTVDYGCIAPTKVFVALFVEQRVDIILRYSRAPIGPLSATTSVGHRRKTVDATGEPQKALCSRV